MNTIDSIDTNTRMQIAEAFVRTGQSAKTIAKKFKVEPSDVFAIGKEYNNLFNLAQAKSNSINSPKEEEVASLSDTMPKKASEFTREERKEMYDLWKSGSKPKEIYEAYNLDPTHFRHAINIFRTKKKKRSGYKHLNYEQKCELVKNFNSGMSRKNIVKKYDCAESTYYKIINSHKKKGMYSDSKDASSVESKPSSDILSRIDNLENRVSSIEISTSKNQLNDLGRYKDSHPELSAVISQGAELMGCNDEEFIKKAICVYFSHLNKKRLKEILK